jgi:hypothetical protein
MSRLHSVSIAVLALAVIAGPATAPSHAQEPFQYESDLVAKRRVFRDVGPGFRGIERGPNGNYYILTAPAAAVQIYDAAGKRVGQVPSEIGVAAKNAALVYGDSFDVDREGRVAVCDRGANAVKFYAPDGSLAATIPVSGPASLAFLTEGEVVVASPNASRLMAAYDLTGKLVGEFGELEEIADSPEINREANFGHLVDDETGNIYFAFDYMPEPTMRKYDHGGFVTMEISLDTLEFQPAAQAARRAIARTDDKTPSLHRIITAIGVDRPTQDVWLAIGTLLMHFDKDGTRLASFRTFIPGGARLEASTILVEPDRLLIGADPSGIYEFPRPDKPAR